MPRGTIAGARRHEMAAAAGAQTMEPAAPLLVAVLMLLATPVASQVFMSDSAGGISCYQCQSVNQSNPVCNDPFDSSLLPLTALCNEGRKDRNGTFPGRYCFKIKGVRESDQVEVIVRRCSVDTLVDNTLKSHYGHFKIISDGQPQHFFGSVSMCRYDGCNGAAGLRGVAFWWVLAGSAAVAAVKAARAD